MTEHNEVELTEREQLDREIEELRELLSSQRRGWKDVVATLIPVITILAAILSQYVNIQTRLLTIELNQQHLSNNVQRIETQYDALRTAFDKHNSKNQQRQPTEQ